MTLERRLEQVNGSYYATNQMRQVLRTVNGGRAIGNGINMYPLADNPDFFLPSGHYLDGMAAEHVAAFESRNSVTGKLNVTRVALEMELISEVAVREPGAGFGSANVKHRGTGLSEFFVNV